MWLIYLRFDDHSHVKTYHVTRKSKNRVDNILANSGYPKVKSWSRMRFSMREAQ